ncbi:hypothetical protein niasHS_017390 [Heterodera schachtii]|uniref:Uncharacterized protein n=2 Tax=Heterodera TaxID=34509 RepID=A0ABD2HNR4_HETSC
MGRRRSVIGNVPSGSHNRLGDGSGRENAENEVPGRSESRPGSSTGRRSFMANHHRRNDAGCNRHDRIPIRDRVSASRRRPEFGNSRSNIAVSTHRHRYLTGQPNRSFM